MWTPNSKHTHKTANTTRLRPNRQLPSSEPSATQPAAARPRPAANTPPSESPSSPKAAIRLFTTTSSPSASRATLPSSSRPEPALIWSSKRNLSQTTSPLSHYSQQPSCDRFVRLHGDSCQVDFGTGGGGSPARALRTSDAMKSVKGSMSSPTLARSRAVM